MIENVSIKHFQSLHDVSLKLDRLTVIVGPSSSGKSAFTRALKTLTGNARGDSFITHGENQTTLIAKTDRGTVALQRGKKNEYVIIPNDGEQKTFTKLAGAVPDEVSEFIGIPARDPLNYANQFDMPYLLTASAAEVARTLGELTNVSVIFEAAREANKRRLAASATLRTRTGDYEALTSNLDQYRGLKQKEEALAEAEAAVEEAREIQTRISVLTQALAALGDLPEEVETRDLPDITSLKSALAKLGELSSLLAEIETARSLIETHTAEVLDYSAAAVTLQHQYTQTLKEAGTCPTCGQDTEHLHS